MASIVEQPTTRIYNPGIDVDSDTKQISYYDQEPVFDPSVIYSCKCSSYASFNNRLKYCSHIRSKCHKRYIKNHVHYNDNTGAIQMINDQYDQTIQKKNKKIEKLRLRIRQLRKTLKQEKQQTEQLKTKLTQMDIFDDSDDSDYSDDE